MKAQIIFNGSLRVEPETPTEEFALHKWAESFRDNVGALHIDGKHYETVWKIKRNEIVEPDEGD